MEYFVNFSVYMSGLNDFVLNQTFTKTTYEKVSQG